MKSLQTPENKTASAVAIAVFRHASTQSESTSTHSYPSLQDHPDDHELDEYLMDRLRAEMGAAVKAHLKQCKICCEKIKEAANFGVSMRSAAGVEILCPKWPATWTTRKADAVESVDQSA